MVLKASLSFLICILNPIKQKSQLLFMSMALTVLKIGQFDLIANYFALNDYFFIKLNLSHNGTTALEPESFVDLDTYSLNNYTKELFDVNKMIDWVCDVENPYSHELNTESIVLLGHSRGGGISILQASEDIRVKALITWAVIGECKTPWGQWSKQRIRLPVLSLTWVENRGVSMGLLQADGAKERWILTAVTALIAAGVAWWMRKETNRIDILALALVLGGAVGNIVDRVRFGYVVDFVHVHVGTWSFYVFNVADAAITIGVAILLLRAFFERKPAAAE